MPAIFISYRREDSAGYAGRIHEELEGRLGPEQVFRDADTLRAGQDFEDAIRQRLQHCQACLVLIGPNWISSQTATGERRLDQLDDYVSMEIAAALARPNVLVVPVLVGGATMPGSTELPDRIRPLARRHALSVRDETWEADMDRLAASLPQSAERSRGSHVPTSRPASRQPWWQGALGTISALVLLAAAAGLLWWSRGAAGPAPESSAAPAGSTNEAPDGATFAIDAPSTGNEVSLGDLIYVVVSGSVQRRGDSQRVWLRIRASNEGFYGANFWDDSFRLVAAGQSIAPNGGLNEVLEGRSIRQAVIRFDVPTLAAAAVLRVIYQGKSGEIPLDLSGNGSPPAHDQPDTRDALSHAVLSTVIANETPLLDADDVSTAILRVGRRAFVNTQRITVVVRWTNKGRYAAGTGDLVLRLDVGGEVLAPVRSPSEVVAPESTYVGDVVFDVPPALRTASLSGTLRESRTERKLTLH
jgi:hypothetical protein